MFTRHNIRQGFCNSRIYPFNVDKILQQIDGFANYSLQEFGDLKGAVNRISKDFRAEKVDEKTMDAHGVRKSEKQVLQEDKKDNKQRDDLVIWRQRCMILTHAAFF